MRSVTRPAEPPHTSFSVMKTTRRTAYTSITNQQAKAHSIEEGQRVWELTEYTASGGRTASLRQRRRRRRGEAAELLAGTELHPQPVPPHAPAKPAQSCSK